MSAPKKNSPPDLNNLLLAGVAYLTFVMIALYVNPLVGIGLFVFGILVSIATASFYYLRRGLGEFTAKEDQSFGARVRRRLRDCEMQEDKFRDQANTIKKNIDNLQNDLDRSKTAPAEEIARGEKVIAALKAEFDLRHTKALFFADCATRLKELLDRHQLNESIAAHQKELSRLRATNFDDEAAVEETRYHLEQDSIQLETLSELTKDVGEYFKTEQAEELRQRLEALRSKIVGKPQPSDDKKG